MALQESATKENEWCGRFTILGREPFPRDPKRQLLKVQWQCHPLFGEFDMLFFSSEVEPRQFYLHPWLESGRDPKKSRFLEDACRCGFKILNVLEAGLGYSPTDGQLWSHLFRNRNAGHAAVTRSFRTLADFLKRDPFSNECDWIVPGLPPLVGRQRQVGLPEYDAKQRLARRALAHVLEVGKPSETLDALILFLTNTFARQLPRRQPSKTSDSPFPKSCEGFFSEFDILLIDGVVPDAEAKEFYLASGQVASSLINDFNLKDDLKLHQEHPDEWLGFAHRLLKKTINCADDKFDKWLKDAREHRYVRLLSPEHQEHANAEELAGAFFRIELYLSYLNMARAFGALMLFAWLSFRKDTSIRPSQLEQAVFRRMHFPQYFLGGLPTAFLGLAQVQFTRPALQASFDPKYIKNPEVYRCVATMLGLFSSLNEERRAADRETKHLPEKIVRITHSDSEVASFGDEFSSDFSSYQVLQSLTCSSCGVRLKLINSGSTPQGHEYLIEVVCRNEKCAEYAKKCWYRTTYEHLTCLARECFE